MAELGRSDGLWRIGPHYQSVDRSAEAFGNLSVRAFAVRTLLSRLNKEYDKTIVMVTHDPHAARFATKVRHLEKGALLPGGETELSAGVVA